MGSVLGAVAKALIGALVDGLNDWLARREHDAAMLDKGRLQQRVADMQAAIEAQQRLEKIAARSFDNKATAARLNDGTF